ncbi:hypothetical protein D3C71_1538060 [compost metagenome]
MHRVFLPLFITAVAATEVVHIHQILPLDRRRHGEDFRAVAGGDVDVERCAVGDDAVAVPDVRAVGGDQVQVEVGVVAVPGQQYAQFGRGRAAAAVEKLRALTLLAIRAANLDAVAAVGE